MLACCRRRYSNEEYYHKNPATDTRQLLLVRVLPGKAKEMGQEVKKGLNPALDLVETLGPNRTGWTDYKTPYDSVSAGPHSPKASGDGPLSSRIHAIYHAPSLYPEYIVTYARDPARPASGLASTGPSSEGAVPSQTSASTSATARSTASASSSSASSSSAAATSAGKPMVGLAHNSTTGKGPASMMMGPFAPFAAWLQQK